MNAVLAVIDRILEGLGNVADKVYLLWEREPVAVTAVVTGLIDLAIAYGVPIDGDQKTAILGVISAIGVVVARNQVTPA